MNRISYCVVRDAYCVQRIADSVEALRELLGLLFNGWLWVLEVADSVWGLGFRGSNALLKTIETVISSVGDRVAGVEK